jgi:SAM-dependent methyltransferase
MHELILLICIPRLIQITARLGIADVLSKGPQTTAAIAKRVGVNPVSLGRMLRALSSIGVFAEGARGRYRLTPLARTLCSDRPDSLHNWARVANDLHIWKAFGDLHYAVETGNLPFEHVHGASLFGYLQKHPDQEREFSQAMASLSVTNNNAVTRAYPFGRFSRVVDVGGAHGHLLATILRRFRKLKGVLYDLPQVVAAAAQSGFVNAVEVRERCETRGGDFFETVPPGADAYLIKHVIHDWDDEKSVRLLSNCREAMAPGGRVLVVEHVIAKGNGADLGKLMDIAMMTLTGGVERTAEEFRVLLARAGLRLRRVIPTTSPLSIVEAVST